MATFQLIYHTYRSDFHLLCCNLAFARYYRSVCRFSICPLFIEGFPVRSSAYITRISTDYRMQYIACIRLYPFVSCLAACRHLEDAVNLQFYSVLLHFIRSLVLVGYQPNDKEHPVLCSPATWVHRAMRSLVGYAVAMLVSIMHQWCQ